MTNKLKIFIIIEIGDFVMRLCIFGAASEKIDRRFITESYELAKFLAGRGHDLIFGAGGEGIMGATARGFKEVGANVIGVIPKFFEEKGYEGVFYQSDKLIYTDTMAERKAIMEEGGDAFIVLPGGIGTFEEFFEVLTLKQLGQHKKAIAIYSILGYFDRVPPIVDKITDSKFVDKECASLFRIFTDKNELAEYVENYDPTKTNWELLKRNG